MFLDRDGTLNYDPGYLKVAADLKLLAGVGPALARLKRAGAKLVVVTNQSGVGRGILTLKDLEAIHARLQGLLEQEDAALDAIYFCPHHPDDGVPLSQTERRNGGTGRVGVATGSPTFLFDRRPRARHTTGAQGGRQGDSPHTSVGGRAERWIGSRLNRPCRMPWRSLWLRQLTGF